MTNPTSTEKVNKDGSTTTTRVKYRADGTKVTSRKTTRSRTPPPNRRARSKTPPPSRRARSKTPPPPKTATPKHTASKSVPLSLGGMLESLEDILGAGHHDNAAFENAVRRCIPSEFLLVASQDDYTQAQEDYYAMDHFKLPCSPSIRKANAGSVATCALLQLMHENPNLLVATNISGGDKPLTCLQVSQEIKRRVKEATKLEAKPTISSSRPLGPPRLDSQKYAPFYIVPPGYNGKRRALLIGVVSGEGPDLKGPPNDVENIHRFLNMHCGFKEGDITVLRDDVGSAQYASPTKKNILASFAKLVKLSKPKDVVFIQFSGHGGRLHNNLYILPSDFKRNGQIMDEDILKDLIKAMPASVYTTMLVDCCYSGTVGDLPYVLQANQKRAGYQEIENYFDTDTRQEMLHKEAGGGKEYQEWKRARAERRSLMRLPSAVAQYLGQGLSQAAQAATTTASTATAALANTGNAAATTAYSAASTATTAMASTGNAAATTAYSATTAAGQGLSQAATATASSATTALTNSGNTAATSAYSATTAAFTALSGAANTATSTFRPKK